MEQQEPEPIRVDEKRLTETSAFWAAFPGIITAIGAGIVALAGVLTSGGLSQREATQYAFAAVLLLVVSSALGNVGSVLARRGAHRGAAAAIIALLRKRGKL